MPREIITLGIDGTIQSEFDGFDDNECFKKTAEIAEQLKLLGIEASVTDVVVKDAACAQAAKLKEVHEVKEE